MVDNGNLYEEDFSVKNWALRDIPGMIRSDKQKFENWLLLTEGIPAGWKTDAIRLTFVNKAVANVLLDAFKDSQSSSDDSGRLRQEYAARIECLLGKEFKALRDKERNREQVPIVLGWTTTGYSFDGYKIAEYKGVCAGEMIIGTGVVSEFGAGITDFFGAESNMFGDKLREARENAIKRMAMDALEKGGNAIIGVSFQSFATTSNMLMMSATGTSVVIVPDNE